MAFITKLHAEHLALKFKNAQDRFWDATRQERELQQQLKDVRSTLGMRESYYKFKLAHEDFDRAHEDFDRAFAPLLEGEAKIDGYSHRFPHCDMYVLHAPGKCRYCDKFEARQAKRVEMGVAFTGETPTDDQIPCPSEMLRPAAVINRWGGNRPYPEEQ